MERPRIVVVSRDDHTRVAIAKALDAAPATWSITIEESEAPDADVVIRGRDAPGPGLRFDADRSDRLIADVESALRALRRTRSIVVAGASGGCGTTTIALHVAAALAADRSCCVVEADQRCGLRQRLHLPLDALDRGGGDALSDLPVAPGFRVSLAPHRETFEDASAALDRLAATYDVLIIDAGVAPDDTLVTAGDLAVLVIPATASGMLRARAWLDAHPESQWASVVNRTGPGSDLTTTDLRRLLQHSVTLDLPCTASLRDAEDDGRLLTSDWTRWSRRVKKLAAALLA